MFQTVKLNLLIPIYYNNEDIEKITKISYELTKAENAACKARECSNPELYFKYYFTNKHLEKTRQLSTSPIVNDDCYRMERIVMKSTESPARDIIGLSKNENTVYKLNNGDIQFTIEKIKILFTQSHIGFIHLELLGKNLDEEHTRLFVNSFKHIETKKPYMMYSKKILKEVYEEKKLTFRSLIHNIIALQTYIPISLYDNKICTYVQISLIGTCDTEDKMKFFDSIQDMNFRRSSRNLAESKLYYGSAPYINRFAGERTVCIFGDTEACDGRDLNFITDIKNGLIKTATENYTTIYAYLISLKLLLLNREYQYYDYITNISSFDISSESDVNDFFKYCFWNAGWNLKEKIQNLKDTKNMYAQMYIMKKVDKIHHITEDTFEGVKVVNEKMNYLTSFITDRLVDYIEEERQQLKIDSQNGDEEIGGFIGNISAYIDGEVRKINDDLIEQKGEKLKSLFGASWEYLLPTTQTSLISATILLDQCSNMNIAEFDYSGICICATSALESELKRIFFDGFLKYMVAEYQEPKGTNAEEIYRNWPEYLLTVPKSDRREYTNVKKISQFTMGKLPYLFGETGYSSGRLNERIAQSRLIQTRMTEYLGKILKEEYLENGYKVFYMPDSSQNTKVTYQKNCFVSKCEIVRNDYRNKAAHTDIMSLQEAKDCYQTVITKPDAGIYNEKIAGVLIELFSFIDGNKLNQFLGKDGGRSGQIVEMTNLEVTSKKGLRGIIAGTNEKVSLSKKYLSDQNVFAKDYIGKSIQVKLVQYDANGKTYSAEFL